MARLQVGRWDPFRDLMSLQTDLNRLFNQTWGSGDVVSGQGAWTPFLDLYETEDTFVAKVDLPGLSPEDVEITLDQNLLTIRGERKFNQEVKEESYHRFERRYGAFQRTISLPTHVDADGIQASFTDGVLEVIVPKAEQSKPRRIKIGQGAPELTQ